jgi:hypothetical protein
LIPHNVKQQLHNLPVSKKTGVVIDLIEYEDMDHVGVRTYEYDLGKMTIEERLAAFEHVNIIVATLRANGISAVMEKVAGSPPGRRTSG